jgi:hypothetical protein
MHMPKQQWSTPVSLLPKEDQAKLFRELFDQHFPWLAPSQHNGEQWPDQRGFIIGSVRL